MVESAPAARESQVGRSNRDVALKVGKWLVDKSRFEEAIGLMSAYAATGPNDELGQKLLAEALQIDSASTVAKAAFGRMEGIPTPDDDLDGAIAKFTEAELNKLEAEMKRPQFLRAQVGFNNNLKYKGADYHVQTEDSGLNKPHIITHLFADGGRVIKSHKRLYGKEVSRSDVVPYVRALMKGQHMEMVLFLREGRFDDVIAGKVRGGMTELTEPPNVDVQKMGGRKKRDEEAAKAKAAAPAPVDDAVTEIIAAPAPVVLAEAPAPVVAPLVAPAVEAHAPPHSHAISIARPVAREEESDSIPPPAIRVHLRVLRAPPGIPTMYSPPGDEIIIGRSGQVSLETDRFVHPSEAAVKWRDGRLLVEDLDGGNGVFIRLKSPVELEIGDEFIVGDQLLRVERNPTRHNGPGPGPTYFWSSPMGPSAFRVVQVLAGGAIGESRIAGGTTIQIGSVVGEMLFPTDPMVSEQHCFIEEQAGAIVLSDLDSRTGVFVRIRGEQEVFPGDELLVGRSRLRVEAPAG
ncbi:MAG: FHA domain-containing protein [Polyangiales bacterium]